MDKYINGKTLIPISSISVMATVIIWVSLTYAKVQSNEDKIEQINIDKRSVDHKLDEISQRLSKIEGFLMHMAKSYDKGK